MPPTTLREVGPSHAVPGRGELRQIGEIVQPGIVQESWLARKLGAHSRAEIAAWAAQQGLIDANHG